MIDAVGRESIANAAWASSAWEARFASTASWLSPASPSTSKRPYNFNLFVHQWPTRSRERAAMEPLCDWVRQGNCGRRISSPTNFPMERIAEAIQAVRGGEALKVLLRY